MHNFSISRLVRSALNHLGCHPSIINDVDDFSPIVLEFNEMPSIYVEAKDCEVWLWSPLIDLQSTHLDACAPALLRTQMQRCFFVYGDHLYLEETDFALTLNALVHPNYIATPEKFSVALEAFQASTGTFRACLV